MSHGSAQIIPSALPTTPVAPQIRMLRDGAGCPVCAVLVDERPALVRSSAPDAFASTVEIAIVGWRLVREGVHT